MKNVSGSTAAGRLLTAGSLLVISALGLSACSPAENDTAENSASFELVTDTADPTGDLDSFTWSLYAEPYSLAFPYAFDYPSNQILSNVCESLLRWNADLSVSPGLATAWANPTPDTWTFDIRSGVTFHDGTPLTAADVAASLSLNLDPAVGSYWSSVYANVTDIAVTGDMQVTVTTATPDSQFPNSMATAAGVVESAATLSTAGPDYGNPTTGVNCTGPFSFGSWSPGQSITLDRFDGYWDADLRAKSEEVTFVFLGDPTARANAFTSGDVDGGWSVPSNAIDQLQSSGAGKVYFGINNSTTSEIVADMDGPLGDVNVRKAMMMAIDRDGIVAAAENGYATKADALVPKSGWAEASADVLDAAFDNLTTYEYDVDAAKKLVEEAGVAGEEIVIATSPTSAAADVMTQAVAAAATAIGLEPTIQTISPDQYSGLFSDPGAREGIDLFYTNWYLSTPEALEMYAVLQTGQFSNYGGWSDADFDAIVKDAIAEPDAEARGNLTAQAQTIASDELPWLPLYTTPTTVFLSNRITGVQPSINYLYYPWAATIGAAG
jgi:peptide/nickel transport system substrate-binding protein